jgi:hypothetical protein
MRTRTRTRSHRFVGAASTGYTSPGADNSMVEFGLGRRTDIPSYPPNPLLSVDILKINEIGDSVNRTLGRAPSGHGFDSRTFVRLLCCGGEPARPRAGPADRGTAGAVRGTAWRRPGNRPRAGRQRRAVRPRGRHQDLEPDAAGAATAAQPVRATAWRLHRPALDLGRRPIGVWIACRHHPGCLRRRASQLQFG